MTTVEIIEERMGPCTLYVGSHKEGDKEKCAMEEIAYRLGQPHGDQPECVSPVIGAFLRRWQDDMGDDDRNRLIAPLLDDKPWLERVGATGGDGHDEARGWMCADWAVRVAMPTWLELAGVKDAPAALRDLPEITADTYPDARALVVSARDEAYEIRAAGRARIQEAVKAEFAKRGRAAWAAGAAEAAGAAGAAWAAGAAGAAGAAWAAGAAGAGLYLTVYDAVKKAIKAKAQEEFAPTTRALMPSALALLERMVDAANVSETASTEAKTHG
jgi:hypothetical protein